ncbi:MAG TPA: PhzF family phenazine biosynthesis protein [Rhodoblastus sp.]|nr:PhzF family phenazine biosynthesis protein [Rhodoblastus sp.]
MARRFFTLDVFARDALSGNPLAVVIDAEGLDDARMLQIAREFNLSETVFVLPARNPVNTARVRIFTPAMELPFAGHPTVGSAVLLASLRAPELAGGRDLAVVLEENVGDVNCTVRLERRGASFAYFDLPRLPEKLGEADARTLADALSLEEKDIGFDGHRPVVWSAGTPFCFVPVSRLDAIARAKPDAQKLTPACAGGRGAWLYTRETADAASAVHARMFSALMPGLEDPATGAAAAAFAGVAHAFEKPADGEHALVIEQGFEMGRPSHITLGMSVTNGALVAATIGGHAVRVSEGILAL